MKKALLAVTVAALCLLVENPSFAQEKPWETISQRKCKEFVDAEANLTPMAEAFFYWFNGYVYGLKGASVLDNRLKALSNYTDASAAVLAFCAKKPEDTLIEATTSVAEFAVNSAGPGKTLNLDWR